MHIIANIPILLLATMSRESSLSTALPTTTIQIHRKNNHLNPTPKLILLDRDGVINHDVGSRGVLSPHQFHLTSHAGNAIGRLKRNYACHVAIITNQSCVGKGLLSLSELDEIHGVMRRKLLEQDECAVIDQIYVCTLVEECDFRKKPNPGMIMEACNDWGVDDYLGEHSSNDNSKNDDHGDDYSSLIFIGDTLTDLQAARRGGIHHRILVQTGYGFGLMGDTSACHPPQLIEKTSLDYIHGSCPELKSVTPFIYAANLADAVDWIVGDD